MSERNVGDFPALGRRALMAAVLGVFALGSTAEAQDWPARPLTLVVPYAAGGPTDLVGRTIAAGIGEALGVQVVVENVGGAGGAIGTVRVIRAAPDGYHFVLGGSGSLIMNPLTQSPPSFDAVRDLDAVGLISTTPLVLITRKELPPNNLQEFIAHAKANPGLTFGSGGGVGNFACVLLGFETKTNLTHVPYRGAALATQDLQAGRIDMMCEFISTALPHVNAGAVKAVATLSRDRTAMLPELPTAHEQGLTDFDVDSWLGLFVPKGTPDAIVQKLNAALARAMDSPAVRTRFESVGVALVQASRRSSAYLADLMHIETKKWTGPIKVSTKPSN